MAKSTPSLLALLGVAAVAGYQNRDKLREFFGGGQSGDGQSGDGQSSVSGGLGELIDRFRSAGKGTLADSWVGGGRNEAVGEQDIEHVIGDDTLATLMQRTGLSRAELLRKLAAVLPDAVNHLTPQGRIPTDEEARGLV